jgi:hypothetical protein
VEELAAHLGIFAAAVRAPVSILPAVLTIGSFAALVPRERSPALDGMAADCVRAFDEFRAPLSDDERRKRLTAPLTARHKENLERWGYPHVFEDFRFHMTLAGPIAPAFRDTVLLCLHDKLMAIEGREMQVDRIALLCQPDPGTPFHLVASVPFSAR